MSFQAAYYVFAERKDAGKNRANKTNEELISPRQAQERWEAAKQADAMSESLDFFGRNVGRAEELVDTGGSMTAVNGNPSDARSPVIYSDHNEGFNANNERNMRYQVDHYDYSNRFEKENTKKKSGIAKVVKLMNKATEEREVCAGKRAPLGKVSQNTRPLPPKLAQGNWLKKRQSELPEFC